MRLSQPQTVSRSPRLHTCITRVHIYTSHARVHIRVMPGHGRGTQVSQHRSQKKVALFQVWCA